MLEDQFRAKMSYLLIKLEMSKDLEIKKKIKEEINCLRTEYKKQLIEENRRDNNDKHKGK